ncbi:hypothetical protein [Pseudolysinimonas sp.]|jgi:hypothetical protein|uniref:hypothetical protein n=1 Tax=Pseudolysinimonas sp. TaxID=2680009 RepID=UPI003784433C
MAGAPVTAHAQMIRSTQQYALVDGDWYETARFFEGGRYPVTGEVALFDSSTGERFVVPAAEIERIESVTSEARYRGYWFEIGSLWSTPNRPSFAEKDRGRIRGAVPSGAPGVFAAMIYRGSDGAAVAALPGIEPGNEWPPSDRRPTATVPVSELESYRESVHPLSPR